MERESVIAEASVAGPAAGEDFPLRLEAVETCRGVPIYHLTYDRPVVYDRAIHEKEIAALAALPPVPFALVVCYRNISWAFDYTPSLQAELYASPPMRDLGKRILAVARYEPGSFTSLIRTMTAHLYARHPSAFSPGREDAFAAVRAAIEEAAGQGGEAGIGPAGDRPPDVPVNL